MYGMRDSDMVSSDGVESGDGGVVLLWFFTSKHSILSFHAMLYIYYVYLSLHICIINMNV